MPELILELTYTVVDDHGNREQASVRGEPGRDGLWHGWLEFSADSGRVLRTGQETEQSTRDALVYWATGLEPTYLEGAFQRAQEVSIRS
jgi:hypothetical protein